MTTKFSKLYNEAVENSMKSSIETIAQSDVETIKNSDVDEQDISDIKTLHNKLAAMGNDMKQMQEALKASSNIEQRQQKIQKGSGGGKVLKTAGTIGGATGASISGNAIYKIYNNLEQSVAEFQQWLNTSKQFMESGLVQKANTVASKISGFFSPNTDDGMGNMDSNTSPSLGDMPLEQMLENIDMAKFGLYVMAISYIVHALGKILQWMEGKYHTSRLKSDRKSYINQTK
jgi:Skp family chaperone for outer membrane proteins|tara:strand:+ start:17606 stop:18298 length:693 start_codon:yes stop_codon:yes gene_type:complete